MLGFTPAGARAEPARQDDGDLCSGLPPQVHIVGGSFLESTCAIGIGSFVAQCEHPQPTLLTRSYLPTPQFRKLRRLRESFIESPFDVVHLSDELPFAVQASR